MPSTLFSLRSHRYRTWGLLIATFALLTLTACHDDMVCVLSVYPGEPLITITKVTNKSTGAPITEYTIKDIWSAGVRLGAGDGLVVTDRIPGTKGVYENGVLHCSGECRFGGMREGEWRFVLSAPGRPDTSITLQANYTKRRGGACRNIFTGGLRVALSL